MKLIAANWKMNSNFEEADAWLDVFTKQFFLNREKFRGVEVVVCPPSVIIDYIDSELMQDGFEHLEETAKSQGRNFDDFNEEEIKQILIDERPIKLGGQDCHYEKSGSFTGDISVSMLKEIGCEYVILGHSERRAEHCEASEVVNKKVHAAVAENITPIICVGETKQIRDSGGHVKFVLEQIAKSVPQDITYKKLVIAYEPIWSIGTGVVPTIEQILEMAEAIANFISKNFASKMEKFFLLYGGSVNAQNSAEILNIPKVNGLLVGKASLDVEEFLKICLS
jgi:triosephosphate isomerase